MCMESDGKFVSLHSLQALALDPSVNSGGPKVCFQPIRLLYFQTSVVLYPSVHPPLHAGYPFFDLYVTLCIQMVGSWFEGLR